MSKIETENIILNLDLTPIPVDDLPKVIRDKMTNVQRDYLIFSKETFKIIGSPVVQSFQVSSSSDGSSNLGGVSYAMSQRWNVYGGLGSINMTTVNQYKTDIQLRLEDRRKKKDFISVSLPFKVTLSIERGDMVDVFYARGGLLKPVRDDFRLGNWEPFLAENKYTKQVIPLRSLPRFLRRPPRDFSGAAVASLIIIWLGSLVLFGIAGELGNLVYWILFLLSVALGALVSRYVMDKKHRDEEQEYLSELKEAKESLE